MVTLAGYIKKQLAAGYSEGQIRNYLLKYNYPRKQIDHVFSEIQGSVHHKRFTKQTINYTLTNNLEKHQLNPN